MFRSIQWLFPLLSCSKDIHVAAAAMLFMASVTIHIDYFQAATFDTLSGAGGTVVVTGANTGIGYATAQQLHALGYIVILACRNAGKCTAAGESIRLQGQLTNSRGTVIVAAGLPDDLSALRSQEIQLPEDKM